MKLKLNQIKSDLKHLRKYECAIYGSYATGHNNQRSDIDIAVMTRKTNPEENVRIWKEMLRKAKPLYHINVFELLPLNLKSEIMDSNIVLFGDKLEISEYFYHFRKLWNDEKGRYLSNQFSGYKEKMEKMEAA